jgi:hypothetical protein
MKLSHRYCDDAGIPRNDECGKPLPRNVGEWADVLGDQQYHRECFDKIAMQEDGDV